MTDPKQVVVRGIVGYSMTGHLVRVVKGVSMRVPLTVSLNPATGLMRVERDGKKATQDFDEYLDRKAFFAAFESERMSVLHGSERYELLVTHLRMPATELRRLMSDPALPVNLVSAG